ncbi:MAG: tetratricopeptide repeat protein [Gemmatimonadaceae bacterium]
MSNPRLDALRGMADKQPRNAVVRFGLANELLKEGRYEEAVEHLRAYLEMHDDEGAAYGKLAEALEKLGRSDDARSALGQGIEAAQRHRHSGLAAELEERLDSV